MVQDREEGEDLEAGQKHGLQKAVQKERLVEDESVFVIARKGVCYWPGVRTYILCDGGVLKQGRAGI